MSKQQTATNIGLSPFSALEAIAELDELDFDNDNLERLATEQQDDDDDFIPSAWRTVPRY